MSLAPYSVEHSPSYIWYRTLLTWLVIGASVAKPFSCDERCNFVCMYVCMSWTVGPSNKAFGTRDPLPTST